MNSAQIEASEACEGSCYPICEHILAGGRQCGSPALRGEHFCFYHHNVQRRVPQVNFMMYLTDPQPERNPNYRYEMPYIEDPESLQMAFTQFLHAVTEQHVSTERGWLLLSTLHGAARNLRLLERATARREKIARAKQRRARKTAGLPVIGGGFPKKKPASVKDAEVKTQETA
jgi:hypothetical protein